VSHPEEACHARVFVLMVVLRSYFTKRKRIGRRHTSPGDARDWARVFMFSAQCVS
jgi:hypothetical protein